MSMFLCVLTECLEDALSKKSHKFDSKPCTLTGKIFKIRWQQTQTHTHRDTHTHRLTNTYTHTETQSNTHTLWPRVCLLILKNWNILIFHISTNTSMRWADQTIDMDTTKVDMRPMLPIIYTVVVGLIRCPFILISVMISLYLNTKLHLV